MKVTKTKTCWEVYEKKNESGGCEMGRPREYGKNQEDFRDRRDAEEYAREIGYGWIKELVFATDEDGSLDEQTFYRERFYRVQPSVITAHARCCRCGQEETFENGVLAYDWKFEHELMHSLRCVETFETDLAYPGEMFPLQKRVRTARGSILVPIEETTELEPRELLSVEEDED